MSGEVLTVAFRVMAEREGAPVRVAVDLDQLDGDERRAGRAGWIDPDSWQVSFKAGPLPFRVDADTLDGRRYTLRFRAPAAGEHEVEASCVLRSAPVMPSGAPPERVIPLVGAGEALSLGSTTAVGDLHVGLQTGVEVVDWYGRGYLDLLVTCHLHEGGAFLYAALGADSAETAERDGSKRPVFRRAGRLPGFGDDGQGYNGRVRAVDFRGDGRFDLLECGRHGLRLYRNIGTRGAPAFGGAVPLQAGGAPLDLGVQVQSVCAVDVGDGQASLIAGTNDWSDYWPKDAGAWEDKPGYRPYDADGTWRGGPLRGRLYLLRNAGSGADGSPSFAAPVELCHEDGTPLEVYGLAGPATIPAAEPGAGFDLLVSDFLDRIWYFRNTGRSGPDGAPRFASRVPVRCTGSGASSEIPSLDRIPGPPPAPPDDYPPIERLPDELVLPTCMHALTTVTWPEAAGGGTDLLVGAEDGYVRALRWVGRADDGAPVVEPPVRLQEVGAPLSVGAKACPNVLDWDGDGRDDLLLGNAAGQLLLCRNTGTDAEPRFAAPVPLSAAGRPLWLMAGAPGTIQGPSEVKWGYINPGAGTWPAPQADGAPAAVGIVCGDALGHNTLYLSREGAPFQPEVGRGRRLHVLRDGHWQPLVTRWRCRPQLVDWGDGAVQYVQVDEDGKVRGYRILPDGPDAEDGTPRVAPLDVLRYEDGTPVQLDADTGGRVGRVKLMVTDWDGDGLPDLLAGTSGSHPPGVNTLKKATVWLLRNTGKPGHPKFATPVILPLEAGEPARFGGHSCVPAPAQFTEPAGVSPRGHPRPRSLRDLPDLFVGSENGRIYAYRRDYVERRATTGELRVMRSARR
jgi:hypothetical protein